MTFGLYEAHPIDLLREELLAMLAMLHGGDADLTRTRIPFSLFLPDFGVNQAALSGEHLNTIAELAETQLLDPALEIDFIIGRASQTGDETNNQSLSEARAWAVRDALDSLAIMPLPSFVGIGSSQPIADLPGHESALNRSVEIRMWYDLAYHFLSVGGPSPGSAHSVEIGTYERAWERGFRNLTDQELEETWTQIRQDNLNDFEQSRFHGYFVGTITNVAIERGRRARSSGTLREKIGKAWFDVMNELREGVNKADRTSTIYRDAERIVEVAHATLGGTAGGSSMVLGQFLMYDPTKLVAWGIYDRAGDDWLLRKLSTTDDYPTRAGGLEWTLVGFNYGILYRELSDPPMLPLQTGSRELVQQELMGP
jgi:hypothetical protein